MRGLLEILAVCTSKFRGRRSMVSSIERKNEKAKLSFHNATRKSFSAAGEFSDKLQPLPCNFCLCTAVRRDCISHDRCHVSTNESLLSLDDYRIRPDFFVHILLRVRSWLVHSLANQRLCCYSLPTIWNFRITHNKPIDIPNTKLCLALASSFPSMLNPFFDISVAFRRSHVVK